jgi:isopentenyl-diphosphate Delta-isomerase
MNANARDKSTEEYDIYDNEGNQTGVRVARNVVHSTGLWHRTVHVWIMNSQGELLLQKRSAGKDSNPNMWDVSVGGHIDAGEGSVDAAIRETYEELGIRITPENLEYLFTVTHVNLEEEYKDREIQDVYLVFAPNFVLESFTISPEEVSEVQYFTKEQLWQMAIDRDPSLVTHPDEFGLLQRFFTSRFNQLKSRLPGKIA